jgi:hypothetical protein
MPSANAVACPRRHSSECVGSSETQVDAYCGGDTVVPDNVLAWSFARTARIAARMLWCHHGRGLVTPLRRHHAVVGAARSANTFFMVVLQSRNGAHLPTLSAQRSTTINGASCMQTPAPRAADGRLAGHKRTCQTPDSWRCLADFSLCCRFSLPVSPRKLFMRWHRCSVPCRI